MKKLLFILPLFCIALAANAQRNYWQQHVNYTMAIEMDVEKHTFSGIQELVFTNNSPDTLKQVFYHLYYNAFQPGSMMSARAQQGNTDRRILVDLEELKQDEIGFQKVSRLEQDGLPLFYNTVGTILQAELRTPLLPGEQTVLSMDFNAQIPKLIRRTGRNNSEDIDYTMTQWYPKLAEYDEDGWHPDQYVAREFFGVWGDFDIKITLPKEYVIGATGVLQNPKEIGHGYAEKNAVKRKKGKNATWHFKAEKVHDFAWAADPDYIHKTFQLEDGPEIHLLYNPNSANVENWQKVEADVAKFFSYLGENFGKYPYPQFSIIQGGDGGMEYPMCTMILGGGKNYKGFFGLFAHEAAHNWYYGVLASNEQVYPWMDEGFASYAESCVMNYIFDEQKPNPNIDAVGIYISRVITGFTEPMSTPADHFRNHKDQVVSSYFMGELFLMQLNYIIGEKAFKEGMLRYWKQWAFKHPKPTDVIKIMEDVSGIQLDWFLVYWTQLTKLTDYAVGKVEQAGPSGTNIELVNNGHRPMPVDVKINLKNGKSYYYTIPLVSMYGAKQEELYREQPPWPWTNPKYVFHVGFNLEEIDSISIDPDQRSCDVITRNNEWVSEK